MATVCVVVVRGAALLAGTDPRSLLTEDRRRDLVDARAAAALTLRRMGWTLEAVGAALGGRQRQTVHHALARAAGRPAVEHAAAALELLAATVSGEA